MSTQVAILSPRITQLRNALEAGDHGALECFWQEVSERGGPLLESIEGNDKEMLVTFLWRDQGFTWNIIVIGGPAIIGEFAENQLCRLSSTDLWYKTYLVPVDLRTTYQFSFNDPLTPCHEMRDVLERMRLAQTDPLNALCMNSPLGLPGKKHLMQVSVLELPHAPSQRWSVSQPDVPQGRVEMHMFHSHTLQNTYHMAVYTPPGYTQTALPPGLLLLFDGWMYMNYIALPTIMDNLLHARKIPPYVVVLLSHLDYNVRRDELLCHHPFIDFLIQELHPWIGERYYVTRDPAKTIVGGVSAGGVTAAFAGFVAPEIFGNVLSQSGSFWSSGGLNGQKEAEWLTWQFAQHPKLALRFSLEIGLFERYTLINPVTATHRFRDVLLDKGYDVNYAEFHGGHDFVCWRGSFPERFLSLVCRNVSW